MSNMHVYGREGHCFMEKISTRLALNNRIS